MVKKYLFTILLAFVVSTLCFSEKISSQEDLNMGQYFQLDYDIGRQSVWTGALPLNIYITPLSEFKRVEITFSHGGMTEVKYNGPQFFAVQPEQTYKVQGHIFPKEKGIHHITINAIAWEYDTNYTSATTTSIEIDENLQIVPQTQEYKILNVLKYLLIVLFIVGLGVGAFFIGKKNTTKIKKWLEPEY